MRPASNRALVSTVRAALALLLTLATSVVVGRSWPASTLGEYAAIVWLSGLAVILPVMGVGQSLSRDIAAARGAHREDVIPSVCGHHLRMGVPLLCLLSFGASFGALPMLGSRGLGTVAGVWAFAVATGLGTIHSSIEAGREDFFRSAFFPVGLSLITLVVAVALAVGHLAFDVFWPVCGAVSLVPALLALRRPIIASWRGQLPEAFEVSPRRFGLHVGLLGVLNLIVWQRTEVVLLKVLGHPGGAGQYAAAVAFAGGAVLGVGNALVVIVMPALVRRNGADAVSVGDFNDAVGAIGSAAGVLAVGTVVVGPAIVGIAFPGYPQAAHLVIPLAVASGAAAVEGVGASSLIAMGQSSGLVAAMARVAIALILFDVVGIALFGVWGAVLSNLACQTGGALYVHGLAKPEGAPSLQVAIGRLAVWIWVVGLVAFGLSYASLATAILLGSVVSVVLAAILRPIASSVVGLLPARVPTRVTRVLQLFASA